MVMRNRILFFLSVVALSVGVLHAQEPLRGPDGGTTYRVSGVELLAIPEKPFSANSRTDWTRILADGSTVQVHLTAKLARDSSGRMYRERRSFMPGTADTQTRLNEIMIYDPVALTETVCTVSAHHCVITNYQPRTSFAMMPVGSFENGTRFLNREELGTNTLEGLDVIGTRETLTVNAGVVGNQRALVTTREFWYSPDLQTNLSITRNDPREGKQVVRLSDLSRSEPPSQLFEVPAGFTVQDARGGSGPAQ
jgi:hypothetical protein